MKKVPDSKLAENNVVAMDIDKSNSGYLLFIKQHIDKSRFADVYRLGLVFCYLLKSKLELCNVYSRLIVT
jgi:hypothetical protein